MEKRSMIRNSTQITVACSSLAANSPVVVTRGTMLNCSGGGTCIELPRKIHEGSIVIIKADGWISEESPSVLPEGLRTLSLAEVKWSKRLEDNWTANYAIGLKYLPN